MTQKDEPQVGNAQALPEQRNDFVAPTAAEGSFMQPNPEPVQFTEAFSTGLNNLAKSVSAAIQQYGQSGRQFR